MSKRPYTPAQLIGIVREVNRRVNDLSAPPANIQSFIYLLNAMEEAAQSPDPHKAGYAAKRTAVLDFVAALLTPEGHATVPVEPTQEMLMAGSAFAIGMDYDDAKGFARKCYRAMLLASRGAK